ncbi:MAG TPA: S1 RNA-binding domain-containing protein, partial [Planctomycetota bacterium]|nr:S1 RNA-binding domain-containing protein [Planctomycetota bacterium]
MIEEGDEGEFGKMLEGSMKARSFEDGETVKGVVVALGPDVAFLDIGGKSEATIDISELRDEEGDIEVEVGETIEALVIGSEGGLKLSRKLARGAAAKEHLGEAFRAGLPVEGKVEKVIKGGYEVRIAGQRAFCPFSQMDLQKTADPNVHVGKVLTFRIIEFKEGGKNLILSRRALLQEEEKARAEETRKAIVPDAVLKGKVVSVRDYGAFVDLGGIQGLLHVSEMGWARVTNPSEVVKPGDEITVKVLKLDPDKGRISLGLKQLQPDPWSRVAETYPIGKIVNGRVVRLQDFGAFIELEPGVEGLAHVSTFPPTGTPDGWKKLAQAGTEGRFEVLNVDLERKRIGVAMVEEGAARARTKEER